jgi:hypothetical protein
MNAKTLFATLVFATSSSACVVVDDRPPSGRGVVAPDPDTYFEDCVYALGLPLYSIEDRYADGDRALACVDDANCFDLRAQTYEFYPDAPAYYDNPIVTPDYRLDSGRLADLQDLTDCHIDSYGF